MKKIFIFISLLAGLTACKKDAGKYCPAMIPERTSRHLVSLEAVSGVPQIMDTLNKYPQLQVYQVKTSWGYMNGNFSAWVACNVFYGDLPVFNKSVSVRYNMGTGWSDEKLTFPSSIAVSTVPSISAEKANGLAEKTIHFQECPVSTLGLFNYGTDSVPDYRLVWRINEAGTGYPLVELDAHSGEVYYFTDGIIYN